MDATCDRFFQTRIERIVIPTQYSMKMRHSLLTFLVLCSNQVLGLAAESSKNPKVYTPIALEFDKEYSIADLEQLFAQNDQQGLPKQQDAKLQHNRQKRSEPYTRATYPNPVPANHGTLPVLSDLTAVKLYSDCPINHSDVIEFQVGARYNGKWTDFVPIQNIESMGKTELSMTQGDIIQAEVPIFHRACRAERPDYMCAYYYKVTLQATAKLKNTQNVLHVTAWPGSAEDISKRPVVYETCRKIKKGERPTCPPISANVCKFSNLIIDEA
ncbi:protein of unknown function [Taphrina deformans PYCC 5710]|uniref:Uncharacterized protein n=1 Tax=Taphrina deformans (strain PYCC 5710 / ATCC 11124 / CBS 356.35 / IMI 108563 / JCM 9778 / NBRC 8474) TaxID=1097556 RepID=R4XAU9_TAPDE|nr:protein of unknown function [Taphrina deformans PYCC 5710]|eukprot:CCG81448.1 protein of unknown function [Taphrina deformans PYCC 5710]